MANKRRRIEASDIIEKARKAKLTRVNVTYRIDGELMARFMSLIEGIGISGNQIVETMIREFVESGEDKKR
ncbi:MAG: hypothetical protein AB7G93_23545 [Bdellovibrionales bacterium]